MSVNIIDLIQGQLGSALITRLAAQLQESESGISKAISGLLPVVFGGIANNSTHPAILDAVTGDHHSALLGNLQESTAASPTITAVVSAILGEKTNGILDKISEFSGISNASSGSLLNIVAGAIIGSIGKYAADQNMERSEISTLLDNQKSAVASMLPIGLSASALGLENKFEQPAPSQATTSDAESTARITRAGHTHLPPNPDDKESGSVLKWLIPLVLLTLAAWFLWKQCDNRETTSTEDLPSDSTIIQEDTVAYQGNTPSATITDIDLNGTPLKGYANGMEQQMIDFLKSGNYQNAANDDALKETWYDFDNVHFQMGSYNKLEPGSEGQLENLAKILKAYPEVKIKVGGYTDKVGDEAANVNLSQQRANFIKSELEKLGVGSQVTGAEGYGSQHATIPADASDEARAVDRRMSVRFTK